MRNQTEHSLFLWSSLATVASLVFTGCGGEATEASGLTEVTLQTDWYAQTEHGGFYQAVAEGYYESEGLEVSIDQGGPNALATQKVASRNAEFAIGRSDDVITQVARGIPLVIVGALMQHDPQAILVHEESGVESFADLDGKTVMTTPGAAFVGYLENKYDISMNVTPLDYGMSRFLADKDFAQQCFITNEPYYVAKEGANARALLIADSGYDPYRVIYTSRSFAAKNPEAVKAFVKASIKGWESYMEGPREKADAIIAASNPKMTPEFMAFSLNAILENKLIRGRSDDNETGLILHERIREQIDLLREADLLDKPVTAEEVAPLEFLPEHLREIAQ